MTATPITPGTGIRLKGGAPIPPAPNLGNYSPVTAAGQHLGAVVQVGPEWRPVCSHADCRRRLTARGSRPEARADLRDHWDDTHRRAAA